MRKFLIVLMLIVGIALLILNPVDRGNPAEGAERPTLRLGSSGYEVQQVQFILYSFDYALPIDGKYGAKTVKAVKHFQNANGLEADGITGPQTWRVFDSYIVADRINPPQPSVVPSEPCAEAAWYAHAAGLPDSVNVKDGHGGFDDQPTREEAGFAEQAIPRREAGCDNNAGNSCCGGWFGIHQSNITAPGYRAGFAACGIQTRSDYQGHSPSQKTASACAAAVIYNYWVAHPGQPWPWRL